MILNKICKKYGLTYDKKYRYITAGSENINGYMIYNKKFYQLNYYSGCFYPFIGESKTKYYKYQIVNNEKNYHGDSFKYFDNINGVKKFLKDCKWLSYTIYMKKDNAPGSYIIRDRYLSGAAEITQHRPKTLTKKDLY